MRLAGPRSKAPPPRSGEATCCHPSPTLCLQRARESLDLPSLPGCGAPGLRPRRRGARRGKAAPPGLAAAPPRLTRRVAAHALQVAASAGGSSLLRGWGPALPAGGAALAGAEGAQPAARPPTEV